MTDTERRTEDLRSAADEPATSAFSLTIGLLAWVSAEAKRRGIGKSDLVREILEEARAREAVAA